MGECEPTGFVKGYLEEFPGYYNSGDSGVIDDHGYISVLERSLAKLYLLREKKGLQTSTFHRQIFAGVWFELR